MSSSNPSIQDGNSSGQESTPNGDENENAGHSGEGAASALAQLKTQTRQHRRHVGDSGESNSDGPGQ